MRKIFFDENLTEMVPQVATIGFFDGVHCGHKFLIDRVVREAHCRKMESSVITFDRHPRQVLHSDYQPKLLSTFDEKLLLLSKTAIDNAVILSFCESLANLSAREFMEQILRDRLNVRRLIIGYDNKFGHNRTESFEDYVRYGRDLGIEVVQNKAFVMDNVKVSSSIIRTYIEKGEMEQANRCLGYPYTIVGKVTTGYQKGRTLGFPTANLDTTGFCQLIPEPGVYAVKVRLQQSVVEHRAMMNIGTRPTFDGHYQTLEVHILNFNEDLYGQLLLVSLVQRIRGEYKFDTPEQLTLQLREDKKTIEKLFEKETEE